VSALEVRNLHKAFGDVVAVADVSFEAPAGTVTAILGPNGAGKTTTIDVCCGLRRADGGTVSLLGLDPRRDGDRLRARVGVMPQAGGSSASGVYPSARVEEILRLFAALYERPLPGDPLVERLGLGSVLRTPWRRLSGGEQQRVSLALAVIGRPEVAFLDEPTAGLDVHARHATWDLVRDLRDAGVAVIVSTHAIDEAEQLADSVVIVDGGRVVATGPPTVLTAATGSDLLTFEAPPGLPIDGLALDGAAGREVTDGRYAVTGTVTPATVAAVTAWCAERGVMPDRLSTGGRSLEDVFLDLTGKAMRP
jgi:ABC-2 type transport system ATP-binding protein